MRRLAKAESRQRRSGQRGCGGQCLPKFTAGEILHRKEVLFSRRAVSGHGKINVRL
jgi:hypothetical protein